MDKELEEAQNLTKDDLLSKLEQGRPAHPDFNQIAAGVAGRVATTMERMGVRLEPSGERVTMIVFTERPGISLPTLPSIPGSATSRTREATESS